METAILAAIFRCLFFNPARDFRGVLGNVKITAGVALNLFTITSMENMLPISILYYTYAEEKF